MTGELRGGVDAGMAIDGEPLGMREQRFGPDAITQPPAGHRIGLAPAVEQDDAVAQAWIGEQAHMPGAVIENLAIDLVAQDRHLRMALEPGRQLVELALRHHPAGRVGRAVEDHQPRPRRDLGQHLLGAEGEALVFVQIDRHRGSAREADDAFVNREAGIGIEDLGASLAEHHDGEEHGHLAARHHQHVAGRDLDAVAAAEIGGHRLAQGQNPVGRGIAVMAVGERLPARPRRCAAGFENRAGRCRD